MPNLNYILLLFILFNESKLGFSSCADNWPSCHGTKNTVCERDEKCDPVKNCEKLSLSGFRKAMVDIHNELRNKIALGKDQRGGNSEASNMRAVSYDTDLEYGAQCHINRCKFGHDSCRSTKKFPKAVGQNLYSTSVKIDSLKQAQHGVEQWYTEIENTTEEIIEKFQSRDRMIGHFTQVVWAKTTHIGCALSYGTWTILSCNYGEAGNFIGAAVYKRGKACSDCGGDLKCNADYPGLCGEVEGIEGIEETATAGVSNAKLRSVLIISLTIVLLLFNSM